MNDYLARFHKMVESLNHHPKVQLLHFHTFPPASDENIKKVEEQLGYPLHSSIISFYQQTNGLQLSWIFKSNEQFDSHSHQLQESPLDFEHQYMDYHPEDGSVMILPIEQAFLKDWHDQVYFDFMDDDDEESFMNQSYGLLNFSKRIKPFDCFNKYYDMAFFLDGSSNPPVILGDDHQACYTDSKVTDFESYLEFVLANKGVVNRRKGFYYQYQGHKDDFVSSPHAFWTMDKVLDLDALLLKDTFPLSDQAGSSTTNLKTGTMQQMAFSSKPLTITQLRSIIEKHHLFLASGGAGGKWQTVNVAGLVIGIYSHSNKNQDGEQAAFDRKHIPARLDLVETDFPFANFCGCYAKRVDFSESDLSYSLFTDSSLEECIFADSNLSGVDFSRANLKGASFMNANLQGADFENCDLTNADFTGANLEGSRFPGAKLRGVKI